MSRIQRTSFNLTQNSINGVCSLNIQTVLTACIDGDPAQFGITRCCSNPAPACLVSDLNEIHAIINVNRGIVGEKNIHMKYSLFARQFDKCSEFETFGIRNACIVYIVKQQIMISIGGLDGWSNPSPCDKMYYCRIKEDHESVWHAFECALPYASIVQCQLMLDTLLIGYFKEEKELWCLDLDNNSATKPCEYQWIKCHGVDVEQESYYSIVATQDGFMHFVDAFSEKHCKVRLSQILPEEYNLYAKYCSI
eukprot:317980_1